MWYVIQYICMDKNVKKSNYFISSHSLPMIQIIGRESLLDIKNVGECGLRVLHHQVRPRFERGHLETGRFCHHPLYIARHHHHTAGQRWTAWPTKGWLPVVQERLTRWVTWQSSWCPPVAALSVAPTCSLTEVAQPLIGMATCNISSQHIKIRFSPL